MFNNIMSSHLAQLLALHAHNVNIPDHIEIPELSLLERKNVDAFVNRESLNLLTQLQYTFTLEQVKDWNLGHANQKHCFHPSLNNQHLGTNGRISGEGDNVHLSEEIVTHVHSLNKQYERGCQKQLSDKQEIKQASLPQEINKQESQR